MWHARINGPVCLALGISIFVFKGIAYDVVHTRPNEIMSNASVQGRKIKCLNGNSFTDPVEFMLFLTFMQ